MRTIIVLLTALSIVMLPGTAGTAAPGGMPLVSKVSASAHDDCDHGSVPVDKMMKDCQAAAGCTFKCFSLYDGMFSSRLARPPLAGDELSLATEIVHSQADISPFRPPQL